MANKSFRNFILEGQHPRLGDVRFEDYDVYSWADFRVKTPLVQALWEGWQKLYREPFRGITTDGHIQNGLFELRQEHAPARAMYEAAEGLIEAAERLDLNGSLRYPLDANEWRCWMNPEFYFAKYGVRFEEHPEEFTMAALRLVQASLSEEGYQNILSIMRENAFLGSLVGARHLMNEKSFNFILFGDPSLTEPWGWSLWGHHLSICVLVLGMQMVVSPVFRGCEPNVIDSGQHAGTVLFAEEMSLAVKMMKLLSDDERASVILYDSLDHVDMPEGFPHPADGRNLTGAYEDNRILPYTGGSVSTFSARAQQAVLDLIEKFIIFIPSAPRKVKMDDVRRHLEHTWLTWMGGYSDQDVFHFRIHNPVIICEFDHEGGMYLTNEEPGRFHIHTVVRTPNGNDYGKELIQLWRMRQKKTTDKIHPFEAESFTSGRPA